MLLFGEGRWGVVGALIFVAALWILILISIQIFKRALATRGADFLTNPRLWQSGRFIRFMAGLLQWGVALSVAISTFLPVMVLPVLVAVVVSLVSEALYGALAATALFLFFYLIGSPNAAKRAEQSQPSALREGLTALIIASLAYLAAGYLFGDWVGLVGAALAFHLTVIKSRMVWGKALRGF